MNWQLFSLSNGGNTKTFSEGISQRGSSEVVYRSFSSLPSDVYYWVLPESFRGDKVSHKAAFVPGRHARTHTSPEGNSFPPSTVEMSFSFHHAALR